jgi:flagellar basal body-associated protein FliL
MRVERRTLLDNLGSAGRKRTMSWYGIFMIVGLVLVVGGWAAYFVWDYKMKKEEEKQPKQRGDRLVKSRNEVADWAKKMAAFKSPVPKRPPDSEDTNNG